MGKNTKVPKITPKRCILSLKRYLNSNHNPVLYIVVSKFQVINFIIASLIEKKKVNTKEKLELNLISKKTKPIYPKICLVAIYEIKDELVEDEIKDETKAEVLTTPDNKVLFIPASTKMLNEIFY